MEFAKKMVIVPQEVLERFQPTNTSEAVKEDNLDAEMHRILNNKRLGDGEKWKLYQQVLQRYLHVADQKRQPVNLPIMDTPEGVASDNMLRTSRALIDEIVETFPSGYKLQVRNLLRELTSKGDVVNWTSDGSVYVRGKKIPNSNIKDVINSIVRARKKNVIPNGWKEVMTVLKEINIPTTYIGSEQALRFIDHVPVIAGVASEEDTSPEIDRPPITPLHKRLRDERKRQQVPKWLPFKK